MELQITKCPPSKRNKPKSYIKCGNPSPDIRNGNLPQRKEKLEQLLLSPFENKKELQK
jgi:hypothetical protein